LRGPSKTPIESALIRVDEIVIVVETLLDCELAQVGELDGVVLATTVDRDEVASFEIEDISANGAVGDIDRVVVGEITIAPDVLGVEVPEKPTFPRFGVEITNGLPRGIRCVPGVVGVGRPIPAGSKIEVTFAPGGIPL
jgi:hypothetical protein